MNQAAQIQRPATTRPPLTLFSAPTQERNVARWRINGYRATIVIWTAEEWERLAERPDDAQYYDCGVWCALRLE